MTVSSAAEKRTLRSTEGSLRPQRTQRGRVVIFGKWCKGCGLCVEFCPTGVLAILEDDRPAIVQPEKCTACRWCETHCPDLAILVEPVAG